MNVFIAKSQYSQSKSETLKLLYECYDLNISRGKYI